MNWLSKANTCPGLYYGTLAQDGFLIRLRIPGGLINLPQGKAVVQILEKCGKNSIQVTNRGNLQIRAVETAPSIEIYQQLQEVGLASQNIQLDHFRNVMISPTAGIDTQELFDTRSLMKAILNYIEEHPELGQLSPKFSIGIDGGGQIAIGIRSSAVWEHRYNEIQFSAMTHNSETYLHLALGGDKQLWDTEIIIKPEKCLFLIDALTSVYVDYVKKNRQEKPLRLKHLLQDWGLSTYLQKVIRKLNFAYNLTKIKLIPSLPYRHLGIYPQKQGGLSYIGLSLPLGHVTLKQWQGLLKLATEFGRDEIRLTPWQSIILPNMPTEKLGEVLSQLQKLNLCHDKNQPQGAIIACAGKPSCKSAITETQNHGMLLIKHLQERLNLKHPVNIHLTGCSKSCAQPSPAEITLVGTMIEQEGKMVEGYNIYLGDEKHSYREKITELPFVEVLPMMEKLIKNRKLNIKDD
ncbi:cobalamin biosynthesis protein CobG [Geminocystis sp. NIES-3708]|uniref:precorrin-3B synthase n=1 Tax=Geminocystis sp. NIES-3708 TaxID=1615909 RepID=UPI0005FC88AE|nr:precorrin-3B synthase [Geminocystis sp. NIES-3708]BAQ60708.1 cobalamin biosynthesis protein CobG [Geminocystis sp. NIES-3708]